MTTRRSVVSFLTSMPGWLQAVVPSPSAAQTSPPDGAGANHLIVYSAPAATFAETLPVGNGLLGASVYGFVDRERIVLNESSLWSGEPGDWNNPGARAVLPEVRKLLFAGKFAEAEVQCRRMQGPYTQSYMPMAELTIVFEHGAPSTPEIWSEAPGITARSGLAGRSYLGYRRELDLRTAIASVVYHFGGTEYRREAFVSYPDRVAVVRISAARPGRVSFVAKLDAMLRHRTLLEGETLILQGKAPRHAEPNYEDVDPPIVYSDDDQGPGMTFECRVRALAKGGRVLTDHDGIHVRGADEVVLLIAGATSFNGYDKSPSQQGLDPGAIARAALAAARGPR
jgi:alpha-L-fucosidase 2